MAKSHTQKELNEMEISVCLIENLVIVIKIVTVLERRVENLSGMLYKEIENIKRTIQR